MLVLAAVVVSGCGGAGSGDPTELVVTGSTTLLPIAEISAEGFEESNQDANVLVSGVGSSAGIEAVAAGTASIGTSSRDLKTEEESLGLVDTPVAFDGIAVIVHPKNPVTELSMAELQAVFAGRITNWSELGGPDMKIHLINRDEASGTREAFHKIVMQDVPFDLRAAVLPGTGQVRDVVSRTQGAIGYISLGFVDQRFAGARAVKSLDVEGVRPTASAVADGTYPIRRTLHFFTEGEPQGLARRFIEYVLSDEVQRGAVTEAGFIPIFAGSAGGES